MVENKHGKEELTFEATDTLGLLYKDGKYFKEKRREGPKYYYVEVDPKEYDDRIKTLAEKIMKCPKVDLGDLLRDALYDIPLTVLDRLEKDLAKELELAETRGTEPSVKTVKRERGTCVSLAIGGRREWILRE